MPNNECARDHTNCDVTEREATSSGENTSPFLLAIECPVARVRQLTWVVVKPLFKRMSGEFKLLSLQVPLSLFIAMIDVVL